MQFSFDQRAEPASLVDGYWAGALGNSVEQGKLNYDDLDAYDLAVTIVENFAPPDRSSAIE